MKKQKGMSLIELTFVLVIITSLLLMAARYYRTTAMAEKVNSALMTVNAVYTATTAWYDGNGDLAGLSGSALTTLVGQGLLPQALLANNADAWGGKIEVGVTERRVTIGLANVPKAAGQRLVANLTGQAGVVVAEYIPGMNVFKVVFELGE